MKRMQLQAEIRTPGSKGQLTQLRLAGKVPGVLHDHGGESLHLSLTATELRRAISTPAGMNVLLDLVMEGQGTQIAMLEQLDRDFRKPGAFTHVNLTRISLGTKIEARVPIVLIGQEKRSGSNGIVSLLMHEATVMTSPDTIPEQFSIDVGTLPIGTSVCIRDLPMPEGCVAVADADDLVVHVIASRVVEEPAAV